MQGILFLLVPDSLAYDVGNTDLTKINSVC